VRRLVAADRWCVVNVLSLFSGIGGLELGLERAGLTVVGQVEIDPFCRRVLAKHWPDVPRHDDVRTCVEWWRSGPRPAVHVVAGGPPCQGASRCGSRRGASDPRWGWPWFFDVVRALRPARLVMENPPALLDLDGGAAFGEILGELAALGFDAEWSVLSACAVGAPHTRERLFVLADAAGGGRGPGRGAGPAAGGLEPVGRDAQPGGPWAGEPGVHGVAYGVPRGVDRRRGLGNAVVPEVAEQAGRVVMAGVP
jgi:DNA (cytosine-5)-methyltransferase 1